MKLRLILLILLLSGVSQLYSQYNYGLRFQSQEFEKKFRTGLDLTNTGSISFKNSFKITFDISFRSYEGYGYILRLKEPDTKNQIDLICKFDNVSSGLYLVINRKETEKSINLSLIDKKLLNHWYPVTLEFNVLKGTIELSLDKETISEKLNFSSNSSVVAGFGVVNNYGFDTREVPYISLRSVSIFTDNKKIHHWPLNNQEGHVSEDSISGKEALITNPEWEIYHHSKWKFLSSIKLAEKPKIAYDDKNEIIYLVGDKGTIYFFDLKAGRFDSINYQGQAPANEKDNQIIVTEDSRLLVYSQVLNNASEFRPEDKTWWPNVEMHDSLPLYWHHNKLINPVSNNITTLCGYGFYQFKCDIIEFDRVLKEWTKIGFTGDSIYPRYLSALGPNPHNKFQYYLFGGTGNKSGDQLLGAEFFYDLYLIDFEYKTIKRLWQLDFNKQIDVTPVNSLYVDPESNCFYTLCFNHKDEKSSLRILKAMLTKPGYEFIGDSIPYYFIDIKSYADVFYFGASRKLVAITSCPAGETMNEISIYTIQFPPGNLASEYSLSGKPRSLIKIVVFLLAILLLFATGLYLFLKRRKSTVTAKTVRTIKKDDNEKYIRNNANLIPEQIKTAPFKELSINLLGGFQVFDKKATNITYRFSPIVKELFTIMLLNSYNNPSGISSIALRDSLWPDKSAASASNNRGVNVAKLRSILQDLGGVEIIHENSHWKIKFEQGTFCDYTFINNILDHSPVEQLNNKETLIQLLVYLKRGELLPDIETEWLDRFKSEFTTKIVHFLELHLQKDEIQNQSGIVIEVVNTILMFDPFNETAIKNKCRILNKMGERGLALKTYNEFTARYLTVFNEEFKQSFKQLLQD